MYSEFPLPTQWFTKIAQLSEDSEVLFWRSRPVIGTHHDSSHRHVAGNVALPPRTQEKSSRPRTPVGHTDESTVLGAAVE
jgi:hypothetical protein